MNHGNRRRGSHPSSRRSEEEGRFRSLVENSLAGIALTQDGRFLFVNPAFLRMYGYERPEEIVGRPIPDVIAPESRDHVLDLSRRREAGEDVPSHYEFRGIKKDGTAIHVEVRAVRVTYRERAAVQATFIDVTERKRLEEQLEASVETLRQRNAQLSALNSTVRLLSGHLDMASLHRTFEEHIRGSIPFDLAAVSLLEDERHFRHLATGEVVTAPGVIGLAGSATDWVVNHRQPLIRQDILADSRFRVSERTRSSDIRSDVIIPLISGDRVVGTLSLASRQPGVYRESDLEFLQPLADQLAVSMDNARLYRDLSRAYEDLKVMQSQMVETEKLRALADLAAGVAHNFNNLLTSVLGYAQLLQMDQEPALRQQGLHAIERSAREGARIAKELQEFARAQSERPFGPLDLNRVVQRSVVATEGRWKDGPASRGIRVEVRTRLGDLPPVNGDEVGLGKVVSNLIVNAAEAMEAGGTITITTEAVEEGQGGRSWVRLHVSDTGAGMREEETKRIFEPFFTTKGPQVGQGLGLSAAYGIILRHRGRIEVASEPDKGTTFTVWLPAVSPDGLPQDVPAEGRARVLIIDDDDSTRKILSWALRMYDVEAVEDGQQGLASFEKRRHQIVITDLGMPGLNGWDVTRAVKQVAPETRVFLITGWDVTVSPDQLGRLGVEEILRKPFDLEQIQKVLARGLTGRAGGSARR